MLSPTEHYKKPLYVFPSAWSMLALIKNTYQKNAERKLTYSKSTVHKSLSLLLLLPAMTICLSTYLMFFWVFAVSAELNMNMLLVLLK